MTGFGRALCEENNYRVNCEIKGVNHRFLETSIRMPRRYNLLEDKIKDTVKKFVNRGRIDISLFIEQKEASRHNIKLDKELAITYYNSLKDLASVLLLSSELRLIDIFRLPEVFILEDKDEDMEEVWAIIEKALLIALDNMMIMRCKEGANLAADIKSRNQNNLKRVEKLKYRSPQVATEYRQKLQHRMAELLSAEVIDEQRLMQEAALFADKSSVTEEIVRLHSHIDYLEELIDIGEGIGRKCDFLLQEMLREINTVGAKANDLEMNRIVVEVKAELEKIREQVQNIE